MSYCIAQRCKGMGQCAPRLQHSLSSSNSPQVPGDKGIFNLSNSLTFLKMLIVSSKNKFNDHLVEISPQSRSKNNNDSLNFQLKTSKVFENYDLGQFTYKIR